MPSPSILAQIEEDEAEARRIEAAREQEAIEQPAYFLIPAEKLEEFTYQLAGAVIGIAMREYPDYVMPSEQVIATVKQFQEEFGFLPPDNK